MDDPEMLDDEWRRKDVYPALNDLYDDIWVYGLPEIHDPFAGLPVGPAIRAKTRFTGYLRRTAPCEGHPVDPLPFRDGDYILVTPGGGGDGVELVDWVMRAYERRSAGLPPAIVVLGPFMNAERQNAFLAQAEAIDRIHMIRFTPHIEGLMRNARAVVGMGGYNIFCEMLSFDKPTLLAPREVPRREQAIRAERAEANGLVQVLPINCYPDVGPMVNALHRLLETPPPSAAGHTGLLNGLDVIGRMVDEILVRRGDMIAGSTAMRRPHEIMTQLGAV
jgi:predicted glycosyltransferase